MGGQEGGDVALRPEAAPAWLAGLLEALEGDGGAARARRMLGRRVIPRGAEDDAAVLILFTGDPGAATLPEDAAVLITHRHPNMRSHSGQMAFPGGHIDPEDCGPVDTALREATEETGLGRDRVVPLAVLDAVTTGGSRRRVRPVVAYAAEPSKVAPASEEETDDVFFVRVADLADPAQRLRVRWRGWTGPAFWARGYLIWGFTAVLLAVLIDLGGWGAPTGAGEAGAVELADALARSRNGEGRG